ncbi:MAG: hypothetical protein ABI862_00685 [Ilumatobacteraceae bacterium]
MNDHAGSIAFHWQGVLEHIELAEVSDRHHVDRQVTLIETEAFDVLFRDGALPFAPHAHHRNLTSSR